jgi:hypothetical protein
MTLSEYIQKQDIPEEKKMALQSLAEKEKKTPIKVNFSYKSRRHRLEDEDEDGFETIYYGITVENIEISPKEPEFTVSYNVERGKTYYLLYNTFNDGSEINYFEFLYLFKTIEDAEKAQKEIENAIDY